MLNRPLVSVCMITYNHEQFIAEAIESILIQKGNFPFELIISDDASTDDTELVIREIIKNHPKGHLIKYTRHEKNIGMSANFQWVLNECNGKYIAICEGDDYWIDSSKLKEQVEFLENNKEYVMLADNSIWYDVANNKKWNFSNKLERDIGLIEMLDERQFATASVMFRNPEVLKRNLSKILGDTILWVFLSTIGKIKYRTKVTSVYRRLDSGAVLGTERLDWAKKMKIWNSRLKEIANQIPNSILKERNFREFKYASEFYLNSGKYKMYFASIYYLIEVDIMLGLNLFLNHIIKKIKRNFFNK